MPNLEQLQKTMIACNSIKQAAKVVQYFEAQGVKVISSNSKNDPNSENIKKFQEDLSILVLVVVDRAILQEIYEIFAEETQKYLKEVHQGVIDNQMRCEMDQLMANLLEIVEMGQQDVPPTQMYASEGQQMLNRGIEREEEPEGR